MDQKGTCQNPGHPKGCQSMPNVNIPETEKVTLIWTQREKRRRQHLKKIDGRGCTGEEGAA